MQEMIQLYFQSFDFDVRKTKDARFMDQKVTPDILCIISDCILNYDADRNIEFTKDDIWSNHYFSHNVKNIFSKPDTQNETTRSEYDKFISQPCRTLAYANIIELNKQGNKNYYKIKNRKILEFIAIKERNAYFFLFLYLSKIINDSGLSIHFDTFINKAKNGNVNEIDYQELKKRFQKFIIGNTSINGTTEVNRIFPKILNILSLENNIQGSIGGHISKRQIYWTDLLYNRVNFRDINKDKHISRTEAFSIDTEIKQENDAYSEYKVNKAINFIKKLYEYSEVKDEWGNSKATQVHHIFLRTEFPQLAHYLENLIKLTPTQHFYKAHPENRTKEIDKNYQLTCLLAKANNIESSINHSEFYYSKESFIYVINEGLSESLEYSLTFKEIKKHLVNIYNIT